MGDKREDDKKEEDVRFEYVYNYLNCSRKIKTDRWAKMMSNADFKVC